MKRPRTIDLPDGAVPTEWTQLNAKNLEDELRVHRKLICKNYKGCLDYASALHWSGWSCHWCPLNSPRKERA